MKKIISISIVLFYFTSPIVAQKILTDVSKFDMIKLEEKAIKNSKKLLKIPKEENLSVFSHFSISYRDSCCQKGGTTQDFLDNFILKKNEDYRCYVYNDSLQILTQTIGKKKKIFYYIITSVDSSYIEFINKINPKYVFECTSCLMGLPVFFCYKDEEVIIVQRSDDKKSIISYPLSDLKDWRSLYTSKMYLDFENCKDTLFSVDKPIVRKLQNFKDIPVTISYSLYNTMGKKMGVDRSPFINGCEGSYLNIVFDICPQNFDFCDKRVGFMYAGQKTNKKHYFDAERVKYYRDAETVDGTLYLFDESQKEASGGYDAAIVYWSQRLVPIEEVIKRLKEEN